MSTRSYQLIPDDILLLVLETDFNRNGKSTLPKWRLVNSNCCRLASRFLFKNLRLNFSTFLPSQKLEAARAIHLLQCLDVNPNIAHVVKQLALEGSFEVNKDNDKMPALLRKVLGQMKKLEFLHWDLTINDRGNATQTDALSYTRTNPEGFWLSRSKTITELFRDVAAIPALNKLFLKMPWWEAAILKPLESQAEIHLLAEGAGIYGWKSQQTDELNMNNVFGQLASLDITTQEYDGNSYVHALLQRSRDTLQQLAFRSRNGLDYPEKHSDLVFPKLHTLVWEVYNPNPFDRQLLRLSNRHTASSSISTFDNSKAFLLGFLKRHTGIQSVRIVFISSDNRNTDAGEEYPAITSCAGPFIRALEFLPELEFLQFVGLPVSWAFALSIMKQHPRLQGLWLPILEGSLEHSFQRLRTQSQPTRNFLPELQQLVASGPQLKLLSLSVKKRWFQELTSTVCTMLKNPGTLVMAAVVGNHDLKRRLLFVSGEVCGGQNIEFWRSRDPTFAPVQAFNQIQLGVELRAWEKRTGSSVWLDESEWDYSEDFMNGLKDDVLGDSVFDISRICRGERGLSVTLK